MLSSTNSLNASQDSSMTSSKQLVFLNLRKKKKRTIEDFEYIKEVKGGVSKDVIGKGAFGSVRLVKEIKTGKVFAVKAINKQILAEHASVSHLRREIKIQKKLDHPHIVKLYYEFEDSDNVYLVLEYADMGSLFFYLRKKRKFNEEEAFVYFLQTAIGIDYLHKMGVIHRDLKPENLLMDKQGNIKICDFGWSAESLGQRSTFCGTLDYMSPEMLSNQPHDFNVDTWSMGVLLYEMLHGNAPFSAHNARDKITQAILQCEVTGITFNSQISSEAKDLISTILRVDPKKRPSFAEIFQHPWLKKFEKVQKMNIKDFIYKYEEPPTTQRENNFINNKDKPSFGQLFDKDTKVSPSTSSQQQSSTISNQSQNRSKSPVQMSDAMLKQKDLLFAKPQQLQTKSPELSTNSSKSKERIFPDMKKSTTSDIKNSIMSASQNLSTNNQDRGRSKEKIFDTSYKQQSKSPVGDSGKRKIFDTEDFTNKYDPKRSVSPNMSSSQLIQQKYSVKPSEMSKSQNIMPSDPKKQEQERQTQELERQRQQNELIQLREKELKIQESQRQEQQRQEQNRKELLRQEQQRQEQQRLQMEESQRYEQQKQESQRLELQKQEFLKQEQQRQESQRKDQQRQETQRQQEHQRQETLRLESQRLEQQKQDQQRADTQRQEQQKQEQLKQESQRQEQQRQDQQRQEQQRQDSQRQEQQRQDSQRQEQQRQDSQRQEQQRQDSQRQEQQRQEIQKQESIRQRDMDQMIENEQNERNQLRRKENEQQKQKEVEYQRQKEQQEQQRRVEQMESKRQEQLQRQREMQIQKDNEELQLKGQQDQQYRQRQQVLIPEEDRVHYSIDQSNASIHQVNSSKIQNQKEKELEQKLDMILGQNFGLDTNDMQPMRADASFEQSMQMKSKHDPDWDLSFVQKEKHQNKNNDMFQSRPQHQNQFEPIQEELDISIDAHKNTTVTPQRQTRVTGNRSTSSRPTHLEDRNTYIGDMIDNCLDDLDIQDNAQFQMFNQLNRFGKPKQQKTPTLKPRNKSSNIVDQDRQPKQSFGDQRFDNEPDFYRQTKNDPVAINLNDQQSRQNKFQQPETQQNNKQAHITYKSVNNSKLYYETNEQEYSEENLENLKRSHSDHNYYEYDPQNQKSKKKETPPVKQSSQTSMQDSPQARFHHNKPYPQAPTSQKLNSSQSFAQDKQIHIVQNQSLNLGDPMGQSFNEKKFDQFTSRNNKYYDEDSQRIGPRKSRISERNEFAKRRKEIQRNDHLQQMDFFDRVKFAFGCLSRNQNSSTK